MVMLSDERDYHVRPTDTKHPEVLPMGREVEFKIKKDRMFMKVVDKDGKPQAYQVVARKRHAPEQFGRFRRPLAHPTAGRHVRPASVTRVAALWRCAFTKSPFRDLSGYALHDQETIDRIDG